MAEFHPAFEEYCEVIFELKEDNLDVIQARIAERLGISRPSVSEQIKKLEAEGLVHQSGGKITLTRAGTALAESVVRRHRLAERFLTDILGLSWAEAHKEAGKWEHIMSDSVEHAMNRVLGEPTTCPHGNPIPGSDYAAPNSRMLTDVVVGHRFIVSRIPEELEFSPGVLEFLEDAQLLPGAHGLVVAIGPDGTLTLEVNGATIGLGAFASQRILVEA